MKPTWYVQPLEHDFDTAQRMSLIAQEMGCRVICESYVPFGGMKWREKLPRNQPTIFLGSINALRSAQREVGWPNGGFLGAWADWKALRCSTYFAHWGDLMLSQNYGFYPLAEVYRRELKLWADFGDNEGRIFIRPDTNDKVFNGGVVHHKNIQGWCAMADLDTLEPTLLCLIAEPEAIYAEYRLVVADGKVVAASRYRLRDCLDFEEGAPTGAIDIAEEAAKRWSPHPIFVIDIAEGYCRTFRVIECGSASVAGFYRCDLRPIVEAMNRIAMREWAELEGIA